MPSSSSHRLPDSVRPVCYRLSLEPDLAAFTFAGRAEIEADAAEPTPQITLNAAELSIASASAETPDGAVVEADAIDLDAKAERATLRFPSPIPAGRVVLRMEFAGVLNDQLCGFYRSKYTDAAGAERSLAATQFEATDARRAFPCWDEPAIKAAFEVTLIAPEELQALSNMPVARVEPAGDGKKAVTFERTPPMSTYLLAFVVGDMACVEKTADDGTLVRVWATRGKEELGRFALENSVAALAYMNDYFGVSYPLAKMDHIAVPDFAAGAMENWGAIIYRETALLHDPENSAPQARQRVLEVVAHEMAHMWFGDLVTMEWWDDLWLNESFASWMGDKTVDRLYPEWEMWTQFVSHDAHAALGLDGLRNSHPIEASVDDPAEIRELFDAISYSKGRLRPPHARGLRRPGDVPQRPALLPHPPRLRKRARRPPLGGHRRGGGRKRRGPADARRSPHGGVDQADRLPGAERPNHARGGRDANRRRAVAVPLRPPARRAGRRRPVADAALDHLRRRRNRQAAALRRRGELRRRRGRRMDETERGGRPDSSASPTPRTSGAGSARRSPRNRSPRSTASACRTTPTRS